MRTENNLPIPFGQTGVTRPPLKRPGGKRRLVPHLVRLWRPRAHRRSVEPLRGGPAVALGLSPDRALLDDINPHLIDFYRSLQSGLRVSVPMRNSRTLFGARRQRFNRLSAEGQTDTAEAAAAHLRQRRTPAQ